MKYDERACKFNMDTGCVELTLQDGRKISIGCTGVEDGCTCKEIIAEAVPWAAKCFETNDVFTIIGM